LRSTEAISTNRRRRAWASPKRDALSRSKPSSDFAMVQPSFSSPTRFDTGTRTSSKNTWLKWCRPSIDTIGTIRTPGACMSMSRNEMPRCGFASTSVRTRQKIRFAQWASEVQIFDPLTT